MADFTGWRETRVTQVYALACPSNVTEVQKMLSAAWEAFESHYGRQPYDNEITAGITDEHITLSYVIEDSRPRHDGSLPGAGS